jgi:hypothetical protein
MRTLFAGVNTWQTGCLHLTGVDVGTTVEGTVSSPGADFAFNDHLRAQPPLLALHLLGVLAAGG